MSTTFSCTFCNNKTHMECGNCHSIHYCTKEHQKADWPIHKLVCRQYTSLPPRPSPYHKLGIFFPTDDVEPNLVWIQMTVCPYTGLSVPVMPQMLREDEMASGHTMRDSRRITQNPIRGFNLCQEVLINCRDGFVVDGSRPNRCIYSLIKGVSEDLWCGPVVALGIAGEHEIEDIKTSNLRHISDWLTNGRPKQVMSVEKGSGMIGPDTLFGLRDNLTMKRGEFNDISARVPESLDEEQAVRPEVWTAFLGPGSL